MSSPTEDRDRRSGAHLSAIRRVWISSSAVAALAIVVAFAIIFGVFNRPRPLSTLVPSRMPASWHMYHDPAGYFTIAVPAGWTARRDSGDATGGYAGTGQSATFTIYHTALGNPPGDTSNMTAELTISAHTTPFEHQFECQNHRQPNTTLAGLPAEHVGLDVWGAWLLETSTAYFQIDFLPAGWHGDSLQSSVPTPVPQATVQAEEQLASRILATFTPIPATPLSC